MIVDPFQICTTDMIVLLLTGKACGNVGAQTAYGTDFIIDTSELGIGMLSYAVYDAKIPMNIGLINPKCPVQLLHGGDHLTVGFTTSHPSLDKGVEFDMQHWNGLKPGGPRLAKMKINAIKGTRTEILPYNEFKLKNAEYKVEPNEI